jgi:DNA-binding MarR family transcriptional regulator
MNLMDARRKRAGRGPRRRERAMIVLRSFRVIFGSVRHHFREVEKRCGVSGSQLWILQEVGRNPGIGVSELALRLAIHQSTCSQLVEKLVRRGHVQKRRSSSDQRRVGLTISGQGRRTIGRAPGPAEGVLPEALGELSTRSLVALERALQQVIRHMDLEVPEAADRPLADL